MTGGPGLNATLRRFIEAQALFFVATADREGRVNLSPKGADTLRVLDERRIAWLNLSGSGNETAAHIQAQPRMTLMFCSFGPSALILRVYGQARALHPRDPEWSRWIGAFPGLAGARQIFLLEIDLVATSCGSGVPVMTLETSRAESELLPFYEKLGDSGLLDYWKRKNSISLDGKATGILDEGA